MVLAWVFGLVTQTGVVRGQVAAVLGHDQRELREGLGAGHRLRLRLGDALA